MYNFDWQDISKTRAAGRDARTEQHAEQKKKKPRQDNNGLHIVDERRQR